MSECAVVVYSTSTALAPSSPPPLPRSLSMAYQPKRSTTARSACSTALKECVKNSFLRKIRHTLSYKHSAWRIFEFSDSLSHFNSHLQALSRSLATTDQLTKPSERTNTISNHREGTESENPPKKRILYQVIVRQHSTSQLNSTSHNPSRHRPKNNIQFQKKNDTNSSKLARHPVLVESTLP